MIPVLFHLGPLTVYSFGLMMALGFLAADYVIRLECMRRGFDPEYSSSIVIAAAVMGLIGSRLYAILDDLPTYLADPKTMIFSGSGFVFYGGMIGGILGAYLVSRWYRIGFASTMDMCAPGARDRAGDRTNRMPACRRWRLGAAVQRAVGDGLSARDRRLELADGAETRRALPAGVGIFPRRACASGAGLRNYSVSRRVYYPVVDAQDVLSAGTPDVLVHVLAGAARFLVEFWRINPRVFYMFSEAQLIAFAMMVLGGVALLLTKDKLRQKADSRRPARRTSPAMKRRGPDARWRSKTESCTWSRRSSW